MLPHMNTKIATLSVVVVALVGPELLQNAEMRYAVCGMRNAECGNCNGNREGGDWSRCFGWDGGGWLRLARAEVT